MPRTMTPPSPSPPPPGFPPPPSHHSPQTTSERLSNPCISNFSTLNTLDGTDSTSNHPPSRPPSPPRILTHQTWAERYAYSQMTCFVGPPRIRGRYERRPYFVKGIRIGCDCLACERGCGDCAMYIDDYSNELTAENSMYVAAAQGVVQRIEWTSNGGGEQMAGGLKCIDGIPVLMVPPEGVGYFVNGIRVGCDCYSCKIGQGRCAMYLYDRSDGSGYADTEESAETRESLRGLQRAARAARGIAEGGSGFEWHTDDFAFANGAPESGGPSPTRVADTGHGEASLKDIKTKVTHKEAAQDGETTNEGFEIEMESKLNGTSPDRKEKSKKPLNCNARPFVFSGYGGGGGYAGAVPCVPTNGGGVPYAGANGHAGAVPYAAMNGHVGGVPYAGANGHGGTVSFAGANGHGGTVSFAGANGPAGGGGYAGMNGHAGGVAYGGMNGHGGGVAYVGTNGYGGGVVYAGMNGHNVVGGYVVANGHVGNGEYMRANGQSGDGVHGGMNGYARRNGQGGGNGHVRRGGYDGGHGYNRGGGYGGGDGYGRGGGGHARGNGYGRGDERGNGYGGRSNGKGKWRKGGNGNTTTVRSVRPLQQCL